MTESPQFPDRLAKAVVTSAQVVSYPFHCAVRFIARIFLLVLVLATIPVPPLFVVMLTMTGVSMATGGAVSDPLAWVADLLQGGKESAAASEANAKGDEGGMWILVSGIVAALVSAGVGSILIQRNFDKIVQSVSDLGQRIRNIAKGPWWPGIEVGASLAESWQDCIAQIPAEARRTFTESTKLSLALTFMLFFAFLTHQPIREVKEGLNTLNVISASVAQIGNATNIARHLTDIQNTLKGNPKVVIVQPDGPDTDQWKTHLDGKLKDLRASLVNELRRSPRHVLLLGWDDAVAQSSHFPAQFPAGTVFSLMYVAQGDLAEDKLGICPDKANQRWLSLFREALVACSGSGPLEVTVTGYASIAPVTESGVINQDKSDVFNCEIANQRTEAVAHFLASSDSAEEGKEDNHQWCLDLLKERRTPNQLCSGSGLDREWGNQDNSNLKVKYRTWGDFKDIEDPPTTATRVSESEPLSP